MSSSSGLLNLDTTPCASSSGLVSLENTPCASSSGLLNLRALAPADHVEETVCLTCKRTFQIESDFHRIYSMCTLCKKKTFDAQHSSLSYSDDDDDEGEDCGLSFSCPTQNTVQESGGRFSAFNEHDDDDEEDRDHESGGGRYLTVKEDDDDEEEDGENEARERGKKGDGKIEEGNKESVREKERVQESNEDGTESFESGRSCGCGCGKIVLQAKHRCISPNHDKSTTTFLFAAFCQISDDFNGICNACDRRDKSKENISDTSGKAVIQSNECNDESAANSSQSIQSAEDADKTQSDSPNCHEEKTDKSGLKKFSKGDEEYVEWFPASWINKPPNSPKMFITKHEKGIHLLHQMIPIGAVELKKRSGPAVQLFSRSYVIAGKDSEVKILVQLFYFKCTSGPLHALVTNLDGSVVQLIKDVKCLKNTSGNSDLSTEHHAVCVKVSDTFLKMKEQVPEGVVKNGKYKNYYVWAGARTEREADKTEPGFEKYQNLYFNYKVLKPDILAKAQALQQRAMATTHEGSDSVENSTSGGVQPEKSKLIKYGSKRTNEEMLAGGGVGHLEQPLQSTKSSKQSKGNSKENSKKALSQVKDKPLQPTNSKKASSAPLLPPDVVISPPKKRGRPPKIKNDSKKEVPPNDLQDPPIASAIAASYGTKKKLPSRQSEKETTPKLLDSIDNTSIDNAKGKEEQMNSTALEVLKQLSEKLDRTDKQLNDKFEKDMRNVFEKSDAKIIDLFSSMTSTLQRFEALIEDNRKNKNGEKNSHNSSVKADQVERASENSFKNLDQGERVSENSLKNLDKLQNPEDPTKSSMNRLLNRKRHRLRKSVQKRKIKDIESFNLPDDLPAKIEKHFLMMERRIADSVKQKELSVLRAQKDNEINLLKEKNRMLEEERTDNSHFAIMALLRK